MYDVSVVTKLQRNKVAGALSGGSGKAERGCL